MSEQTQSQRDGGELFSAKQTAQVLSVSDQPDKFVKTRKDAEEWFTPGRFAVVLGLLIVTWFPLVVAGVKTFVNRDFGRFAYPVAFYCRESFWRGEVPLWNPLSSCGIPFLAQWNTMTLYPLSLFHLLLPLPWSFGVFCLGHLFIAGMGMYFLAHHWTGHRLAAAVGGMAFAFNGMTWYGLVWPNIIAALGWMPWVVLAAEAGWRKGRRWLILSALAGAMQIFSGGAEVIILTWLFLGALWLTQFLGGGIPRREMIARAASLGCIVVGLTAVQMAPFLDLLAHSQRNTHYGESMSVSMPAGGWANYLVPYFHSFRIAQSIFFQPEQGWTASYYLGIGIVILALLAAWQVRTHHVWLLTVLALLSLTMALGGHCFLYGWVKHLVPLLGLMRFPIKFVMLATFVIPMLAAYGLKWLLLLPGDSWPRESRKPKALALALLGLMAVILWFAWKHPLSTDNFVATVESALVRVLFLVLVVGCIGLLRRTTNLTQQRLLQTGLILLLWFDVGTHAPNLSLTAPCSVFEPDTIRQFFKWDAQLQAGVSRAMQSADSFWKVTTRLTSNMEADTYGRRLSLFLNFNLLDRVPKVDGFYPLDLKLQRDVIQRLDAATNQPRALEDFLGVSHVNNPTNAVDWISRDSFLPLVTAGQQPVFAGDEATLEAIVSDGFAPLDHVWLPLEDRGEVRAKGRAKVRIGPLHFSAHRLGFEAEADAPAMVVVAQTYYHPWRAYVDGKPVPLWRANYAFQALAVPSGKHQVSVVYEDKAFFWGAVLSLLSLLACAAAWFRWRRNSGDPLGSGETVR